MKKLLSILLSVMLIVAIVPVQTEAARLTHKSLSLLEGEIFTDLGLQKGSVKTITSNNPKVVKVNNYGFLKAGKAGKSKVTIKDYKGKKYTCNVNVYSVKSIKSKLDVKKISYENNEGTEVSYLITNNSPIALDLHIDITGRTATDEMSVDERYINNMFPNSKQLVYIPYNCVSAKMDISIHSTQSVNYSNKVKCSVTNQSEDYLVTMQNKSSKNLDVNVTIIGYDNVGKIVYAGTINNQIPKKSTKRANLFATERLRMTTDEYGYEYEELYYVMPNSYKIFVDATDY